MNFKLVKSDWILYLFYVFFTGLLFLLGREEEDASISLGIDFLKFVIMNGITAYVLVFVIFKRFMPRQQYFLLFVAMVLFLYFMGAIWIQIEHALYGSRGNPFSFEYIQYGFVNHLEEAGILATIFLGKKMYDIQLHLAKVEQEKRTAELQFLKAQIDPHFLFNNLNTIDALIDKDPQGAKAYLHKLSQLYRYLVSSKDQEVVPLEEELAFAKNYVYLIEERFGKAYQFDIQNKHPRPSEVWIPPGALQTLLENIVKHNQASHQDPVKTEILINDKKITVSNDRRQKNNLVDSTGTGLDNLKARYKLLTDQEIEIVADEAFIVVLPLIKLVN